MDMARVYISQQYPTNSRHTEKKLNNSKTISKKLKKVLALIIHSDL